MIRRRAVALAAALGALGWPLPAAAQQGVVRIRRIGLLSLGSTQGAQTDRRLFAEALRQIGYEEGANLLVERRYAEGEIARLDGLAEELVRLDLELLLAFGNDAIRAARRATRTIPIVMVAGAAPVELGLVSNLARPSENVTGTAWLSPETSNKLIQLVKEAGPGTTRIATLHNPTAPGADLYRQENRRAAGALGMSVQVFDITRPDEVGPTLERVAASRPEALYVVLDPVLYLRLTDIAAFALQHKLLSIGTTRAYAEAGGVLAYGPDLAHFRERVVSYVDRILKGAKPADLPVEQPLKFNLVVNLRSARTLGLTIPQSLLIRADEVIE